MGHPPKGHSMLLRWKPFGWVSTLIKMNSYHFLFFFIFMSAANMATHAMVSGHQEVPCVRNCRQCFLPLAESCRIWVCI